MLKLAGRFFNTKPMPKFNKTNRTAEELLAVHKIKGLSIADDAKAVNYIHNIGYYRLKAYFYPLYKDPKYEHLFKVDATFDKVMNMYRFDRKLRLLLFNEIEKIEVAFRSIIVNVMSDELGNIFWMTEGKYFKNESYFNSSLNLIQTEYEKSKEEFIILEICVVIIQEPGIENWQSIQQIRTKQYILGLM